MLSVTMMTGGESGTEGGALMAWSGPVGIGNIGTFPICIRPRPGGAALPGVFKHARVCGVFHVGDASFLRVPAKCPRMFLLIRSLVFSSDQYIGWFVGCVRSLWSAGVGKVLRATGLPQMVCLPLYFVVLRGDETSRAGMMPFCAVT